MTLEMIPSPRAPHSPTGRGRTAWLTSVRGFRQAVRSLRRHPGLFGALTGTLTVGIAAVVAVFAVAEAVLLRPLPYTRAEALVLLSSSDPSQGLLDRDISPPDYLDIAARTAVFDQMVAFEKAPGALAGADDGAVKIDVARVSAGFFELLGMAPEAGRTFHASEVGPDAPKRLIVSNALAVQRFGQSRAAVGSMLQLDGEAYEVIGVVRARPPLAGADADAWVTLPYDEQSRRQGGVLSVVARMRAGVTVDGARADLGRIGAQLEDAHPESNRGRVFELRPLAQALSWGARPALAVLGLAAVLLALVTALNASGLLLVQLLRRRHELTIRKALGASPSDIRMQLAIEGLLVGTATGIASTLLAVFLVRFAAGVLPGTSPQLQDLTVGVLPALVGVTMAIVFSLGATGLAAGSVRGAARLRSRSMRPTASRTRSVLLGTQIAASTTLVVSMALVGTSLQRLVSVEPGFDPEQLVALALDLPDRAYAVDSTEGSGGVLHLYDELLARLGRIAGVDGVAIGLLHPMQRGWLTRFAPEGAEDTPVGERDRVNLRAVSAQYFRVVGATVREGRGVLETDTAASEPVVVVNHTLARMYFGDESAIGRRVMFYGGWWQVVGVVNDFKSHGIDVPTRPAVFASLQQLPSGTIQILVRSSRPIDQVLTETRAGVWDVDPQLAPYDLVSLQAVLSAATAERRAIVWLFGALSLIALVLSAVGLVSAVSENIEARRSEFGLRAALGATSRNLLELAMKSGLRVTTTGVLAGLLLAAGVTRFLGTWLYQVSPVSPQVFALSAALLLTVGGLATLIPSIRALACEPRDLLREAAAQRE